MLQAIEGIYKDGRVYLNENPNQVQESRVIVTFLEVNTASNSQMIQFGMFSGKNQSTEQDFMMAEFHENMKEIDN